MLVLQLLNNCWYQLYSLYFFPVHVLPFMKNHGHHTKPVQFEWNDDRGSRKNCNGETRRQIFAPTRKQQWPWARSTLEKSHLAISQYSSEVCWL